MNEIDTYIPPSTITETCKGYMHSFIEACEEFKIPASNMTHLFPDLACCGWGLNFFK